MNEKQRARLSKAKAKIKASGICVYGDYLKIVCTACKKKVEVRVSNPSAYTEDKLKTWVCPYCRLGVSNPKEAEMLKKKAVVKVKSPSAPASTVTKIQKETVDDIWYRVLKATADKKLPDSMIAQEMCKANPTGKKYTDKDVAGHRSGYNCGRLPCQKGVKPTVRLEKYVPVTPESSKK